MTYKSIEDQRAYQRAWIKARRDEWIKENGPCTSCGSWNNLTVDHIDRKLKLYNVSQLWSMSRTNPKRVAELIKCQVLCVICHIEKTNKELGFDKVKHGTRHCYMEFECRCVPCTEAASTYRNWQRSKW